jgi:3-deoxy-7-phosphoheptulonate synthase
LGPDLVYGQSVTDACMGFDTTRTVLARLFAAVG